MDNKEKAARLEPPPERKFSRKALLLHKGRSGGDGGHFAMLPDDVLRSDAGRTLPHPAHRVLVALAAQYAGHNNGSLSLTRKTAVKYGIGNPHTLAASLLELEARGLIEHTRPGTRLPPRSAFYAVTWRRIDAAHASDPHSATATVHAPGTWRSWKAAKSSQFWVTGNRRAARWRVDTRPGSAGIHSKPQMSSAGIHSGRPRPVARGSGSDISGVGDRETYLGLVGARRFHLRNCPERAAQPQCYVLASDLPC